MNKIILSVIATLLTACGTVQIGQDFDVKSFETVAVVGKTTKSQVRKLMGNPKNTGVAMQADGQRYDEWVYISGSGQLPALKDASFKILEVRFDQSGVLKSYNWSSSK